VVPIGGAALLRPRIRASVQELDADETTAFGSVTVRAVYADHDGRRGFGGPTTVALGYLLSGSRSVYVSGDTDIFPAMESVPGSGGLDVALLPVSGWGLTLGPGHMDAARAARALTLLRPRMALPVHWGTLRVPVLWRARPDRYKTPAEDFARHAALEAPECRVLRAVPNVPIAVPGQGE
jgi:L-ascorbate metabolism protein UlaG (beta-lactamase superfamily)